MRRAERCGRRSRGGLAAALLALAAGCASPVEDGGTAVAASETDWREGLDQHRRQREERLRAADGWLSLVALHWLEPGPTRLGSAPGMELRLAEGAVPDEAGSFAYEEGAVRWQPAPGTAFTVNGQPHEPGQGPVTLADDTAMGGPEVLGVGRVTIHPIARGERHALRVRDPESPARTGFAGLEFYPPSADWRVPARLVRFEQPREVMVPTVVDTEIEQWAPGELRFEIGGRELSLLPLAGDPDGRELWLIFRDATSGAGTYPAGRYLYTTLDDDDTTLIDFNRAYNPPCAFTPFATCPLPPPGNRLPVAVEAGEKDTGAHG